MVIDLVTIKELEKQRIEQIKLLDSTQIKNYVDVLVKEICDLHDLDSVTDADERINEISDGIDKLYEIGDLAGVNFENIKNYIHTTFNVNLSTLKTVESIKSVVNSANSKNVILRLYFNQIITAYLNFNMYSALSYDFLSIKDSPTVDNMKSNYFKSINLIMSGLKDIIEKNIRLIDGAFYSDETIKNDIHDLKITILNIKESDDETDMLLVEFGIIDVLIDLIKSYENHAEIKELYMQYKAEIDELISSADNVFEKYSVEKYDAASGISFDEFMKLEPKFNINTGELIEP